MAVDASGCRHTRHSVGPRGAIDPGRAARRWLLPFVLLFCLGLEGAAADLIGEALVVDGDTLRIAGERIRLHGIDAPEADQHCLSGAVSWPCGQVATARLREAIDGRPVRCRGARRDRYHRLIAVCYAGDLNLNGFMVRSGWALAYRRYSRDYVAEEVAARADGLGMWRGQFMEPWEWRLAAREEAGE